jgi:hypothetical protein
MLSVLLVGLLAMPFSGHSRKLKGVTFPETVSISGKQCALQGIGIRKKLIINVYLGGLYLERKARSEGDIITSDQVKRVHLHFLYSEVGADQLNEAWREGFENNAKSLMPSIRSEIARFIACFDGPIRKGETMTFTYTPGTGTVVNIKGRVRDTIPGDAFMRALFSVWFGPKPPSGGLKEGMMGRP